MKLSDRHIKAIEKAKKKIQDSDLSIYIKDVYLYGSCARGTAKYDSDVDLLLVLKKNIVSVENYQKLIRLLRSNLMPDNIEDVEIDVHTTIDTLDHQYNKLYFNNIRKEGISIWN